MSALPNELAVLPLGRPIHARIELPGSKSLTNRALVVAALAEGESHLRAVLESDDTKHLFDALSRLGFQVYWDRPAREIRIEGRGGVLPVSQADLFAGNAGTAMRFLVSLVTLGCGEFRVDGSPRMRERPIAHLLGALRELGGDVTSESGNGCPPVCVHADGLKGGRAMIPGDVSSQFVSSILLAAPYARTDVELTITGEIVGLPFIDMTIGLMGSFGVHAQRDGHCLRVAAGQRYRGQALTIEPDATAASYFLAAAALLGGEVVVSNLGSSSLQGDVAFTQVLSAMGAEVVLGSDSITVRGSGRLRGIKHDFRAISDTFLTAAVLAPFADSPSIISGIGHTRHQETDRVSAVATELKRLGVRVVEHEDALEIFPSTLQGAAIETYDDHRIAMSFAILGLRQPGVRIRQPSCVDKTFPDFFDQLEMLRGT